MYAWERVRDENVARIRPGCFVRFYAYLPKYGLDAGMTGMVHGPVDGDAVPCLFFNPDRVVYLALADFATGVARCLTARDLLQPTPRVKTFQEAFGYDPRTL